MEAPSLWLPVAAVLIPWVCAGYVLGTYIITYWGGPNPHPLQCTHPRHHPTATPAAPCRLFESRGARQEVFEAGSRKRQQYKWQSQSQSQSQSWFRSGQWAVGSGSKTLAG